MPVTTDWHDYKVEVNRFICQHQDHITIQKIHNNKQIQRIILKNLKRTCLMSGIGRKKSMKNNLVVNAQPTVPFYPRNIRYESSSRKGTLDPSLLFDEPFTFFHSEGVTGFFLMMILKLLRHQNGTNHIICDILGATS